MNKSNEWAEFLDTGISKTPYLSAQGKKKRKTKKNSLVSRRQRRAHGK